MKVGKLFFMTLVTLSVCLVGSQALPQAPNVVIVQGDITSDTTFTSNDVYVLRGAVFVREPAVLTIEPGTLIAWEFATNGTLIIDTGAQIQAVGTAQQPIVMTSDQCPGPNPFVDCGEDDRFRADGGGLIINGRATLNVPGGIGFGEGGTGDFGGNDDADDSGTLRYVRVEYAGTEFSPDNELNGIAFQGTGSGTDVDFIQVHMNLDDGVEFFGGTTDIKHALLTNIGDDSLDYTDGWRGRAQFIVAQQRGDDADQGYEFDNSGENNDLLPRSDPTIRNCTLIGDPTEEFGGESDHGMLLREGTAGDIADCIVLGFKERGIDVDQAATIQQAQTGALRVASTIVFGNDPNFDPDAAPFVNTVWPNIFTIDPMLRDPFNHENPDFRPLPDSPAADGTVPVAGPPAGDPFFTVVDFIGAMGSSPEDDWTKTPANWTTSAQGFQGFLDIAASTSGRELPNSSDEDELPGPTDGAPGSGPGGDGPPGPGCCD